MRVEACAAAIGTQAIDGSLEVTCETIASHPVFVVVTCDMACDRCVASAVASANRPVTCQMPLSETETQRQGAVRTEAPPAECRQRAVALLD
jgi:hypothetical protein